MIDAVSQMDGVTGLTLLAKFLSYAGTLVCLGGCLVLFGLRSLSREGHREVCLVLALAGGIAVVASLSLLPLQASFLAGGGLAEAFDPMLLGFVVDSPLGLAMGMRVGGIVFAVLMCLRFSAAAGGMGSLLSLPWVGLAAASFAFYGHSLGEPRSLLAGLVILHILGLAFWIGAFLPLYRAAGRSTEEAAALAQEFGKKAVPVVVFLGIAGLGLLVLLSDGSFQVLSEPYGQLFVLKLSAFIFVLGLAAVNKLYLTPALIQGQAAARVGLRRSIAIEAALIGFILVLTAMLTTVVTPPAAAPVPAATPIPAAATVFEFEREMLRYETV